MVRHLPLEIRELEIVVVPGLLGEIVAAAVQTGEDIVVDIAAAVEYRRVEGAVHRDMNAHAEEGGVP